jgi:hypothetical protein
MVNNLNIIQMEDNLDILVNGKQSLNKQQFVHSSASVKFCQVVSIFVKLCQVVSICVELCQVVLSYAKLCQVVPS